MPRAKTGRVYVEPHGHGAEAHFDIRFDLPDGNRSRRKCMPPAMSRADATAEAKRTKEKAWLQGWTLARSSSAPARVVREDGEKVDAYVERWLEARPNDRESRQHLIKHVLPVLGAHRALAGIVRADVERVVAHLDERVRAGDIAWKTALNIWGTVTKMFDDARNAKLVELRGLAGLPDPCAEVRPPDRGEEKQSAWLFPREAYALLACDQVPRRWRRVYAFALFTGLRHGEIAVLQVQDIVRDGWYVSVHKARARDGSIKSTKGRRARRVPIEPGLQPFLEAFVDGRDGAERLFPDMPRAEGSATKVRRHLGLAGVLRAELHERSEHRRPLTFHDLRHTFAVWLAMTGAPELVIQSRLGHATAAMTQHYINEAEVVGRGDVGAPFGPLPTLHARPSHGDAKAIRNAIQVAEAPDIADASCHRYPCGTQTITTGYPAKAIQESDPETDADVDVDDTKTDGADPLERALLLAAEAGRFDVVSQIAKELEARRLASSPNVVAIDRRRRTR
jgi:integrase